MLDLNEQAKIVHEANAKWWVDLDTGEPLERNKGELLMLCISEVVEALEGERKGLMDDHLPARRMAEVEMADTLIRLLDFSGALSIHLPEIIIDVELKDNKGESLLLICDEIMDVYWTSKFSPEYLADPVIIAISHIYAYCARFGYDLEGAYHEKMEYNRTRKDHQIEARKADGGKRW